jgi:uncharacterized membrane protein YbhN (UPF0104 family)
VRTVLAAGARRFGDWSERHSRAIPIVGFALVTALVLVSLRAVEWRTVAQLWARLEAPWLLLSIAAGTVVVTISAIEWRLLLPIGVRVGFTRMWRINALTALAVSSAPMLAGHGAGAVLLAREPGVGYGAAVSVLALDQLAEGFAKLTLIALAVAVAPGTQWIREGASALALGVGALLVVLLVAGPRLLKMPRMVLGGTFPIAFAAVLAMKGAEGLGILAAQQSLGISLPPVTLVVVLSATALGTMLPLTPGQIGTYEASAFLAYRWLGLGAEEAMALAIVQHACYLAGTAGAGYLTLSWTAARGRDSWRPSRTPPALD